MIGGGDRALDRLIPDIIRSIENDNTLLIRNSAAIRPWQHVLDPLSGYLILAENLFSKGNEFCGAWNFGPLEANSWTVLRVLEYLAKKWDRDDFWEIDGKDSLYEAQILKLDTSKAKSQLGWFARWPIDRALSNVYEWENARVEGANMQRITLNQINDFCS